MVLICVVSPVCFLLSSLLVINPHKFKVNCDVTSINSHTYKLQNRGNKNEHRGETSVRKNELSQLEKDHKATQIQL